MRFLAISLAVSIFGGCDGELGESCINNTECRRGLRCHQDKCIGVDEFEAMMKSAADQRCQRSFNCKAYGWCTAAADGR
ncbi:MAG: hypothetical protein V1754_09000, partial [Pseudomonadota bacterium]